jgi:16S rRNA (uracil1498-N3)-methyltransferase
MTLSKSGREAGARGLQRFFLPAGAISGPDVVFPPGIRHQILRVFRLGRGARVVALDGSGMEYIVELTEEQPALHGRIISSQENEAEPSVGLHLYQGLLKGRKMELILQKCTEIGMTAFTPVVCDRSVPYSLSREKAARMLDIVREAVEQSGRGSLPNVDSQVPFAEALRHSTGTKVVLAAPSRDVGSDAPISPFEATGDISGQVDLFVGPEGGFTQSEMALANEAGARMVSLGKRTLRAETAAIVGTALVLAAAESRLQTQRLT